MKAIWLAFALFWTFWASVDYMQKDYIWVAIDAVFGLLAVVSFHSAGVKNEA